MTPEGRVKAKVNKALKTLGLECWRFMPVQSGYGTPALDYLLCIKGRFVALETKKPGGKLTPLQEGTKAAIEAAGGIVLIIQDDTSLEIAMKILLALEHAPYGTSRTTFEIVCTCVGIEGKNYTGQFEAQRIYPEEKGSGLEQLRRKHTPLAIVEAVGGHHGAPAEASD